MADQLPKGPDIILSNEDFDRLVDELNNPRPPTPALVNAMKRYREMEKQRIRDMMDAEMVRISAPKWF